MAICKDCKQEMMDSVGCTMTHFMRPNGVGVERIKYSGYERGDCPDCTATDDHYHHLGCDQEKCPFCYGQFLSCNCTQWIDSGMYTIRESWAKNTTVIDPATKEELHDVIIRVKGTPDFATYYYCRNILGKEALFIAEHVVGQKIALDNLKVERLD